MNQLPYSLLRLRRLARRLGVAGQVEFRPLDQHSRYTVKLEGTRGTVELGNKASEARSTLKKISGAKND